MNIQSKIIEGVLHISFDGELDECSASFTRSYLDDAIMSFGYNDVVLDMSNLEFMDSTGIGVLLGRYKNLRNKNKRVFISNPNCTIEKILKMSGIYEIMPKIS